MIIKLYDYEMHNYPLIEIKIGHFKDFSRLLHDYKKENEGDYNEEDFYQLLEKKDWFIRFIGVEEVDKEVFF